MSEFRDDDDEMTASRRLDDATIDALLAGRPVPAELDGLAAFATSIRAAADQPVEPSARLAAMMASGVFPPDRDLPAAPAASDLSGPAQQGARSSRRRRTRMATRRAMVAFATKHAGLSALAKTVTVTTVAAAAVGTAGAAGALPGAAQDTFDSVVKNEAPDHPDNFGGEVSEDARDGGVDGGEISENAKENGNRPDDAGKPTDVPPGPPEHANNPPHPTHPASGRPTDVPPGPPEHANNPPLPRPTPSSRPSDVPPGPPEHANNPSARPTP